MCINGLYNRDLTISQLRIKFLKLTKFNLCINVYDYLVKNSFQNYVLQLSKVQKKYSLDSKVYIFT